MSELEKLNNALINGDISDGPEQVSNISFAVNDDLVVELSAKATELGSSIKVIPVGAHYDQIREAAESAVRDHETYLDDFFEGLLGGFVVGVGLHAGVNGFLVYRGHKTLSKGIEDAAYSSAVTGGGVAAGLGAELMAIELLGVCSGPVGFCITLGTGVVARSILSRVADRRTYAAKLIEGNAQLLEQFERIEAIRKAA